MFPKILVGTLAITISTFITEVISFDDDSISLVLDYFEHKNVACVCLLLCNNTKWIYKFAKSASVKSIIISSTFLPKTEPSDVVNLCLRQRYSPVGVLIDIHCPRVNYLLEEASQEMYFDETHKWLIIEHLSSERTTGKNNLYMNLSIFNTTVSANASDLPWYSIQALTKLNLSVDAEINIALTKNARNYTIYDTFNFGRVQGSVLNVTCAGFWNKKEGLQMFARKYKYWERGDFEKTTLRVIAVMSMKPKIFHPELLTNPSYTPGVAAITKVGSIILDLIGKMHNIRYKYTITDRWIGSDYQNSTRVVSNSLLFREQDMTPSVRVFRNYLHAFEILHPELHYIETKFFYRVPTGGLGSYENEFLKPFSTGAWICTAAAVVVCCLVIMISAYLERRTRPIQFAGLTVFASVCQQSFEDANARRYKKHLSGQRIAIFITAISFYVLYNYYTSSVVSWLLNATPPSIKNIRQLIESPLELIFEDMGYTRSWLQSPNYYFDTKNQRSEDELRKVKVNKKHRKRPLMLPLKEGVELLRVGGYAYHTEPYNAYQYISRTFDQSEICELGSVQLMNRQPVHLTMQRRSPYKEFFLWSLARLRERGHITRIRKRVTGSVPKCEGRTPRPLTLGSAAPAFFLLGMGMAFGSLLLLYEVFHDKISRHRENRKRSVIPYLN